MPVFQRAEESPLNAKLLQGWDAAIYVLAGTKVIIFSSLRQRSSEGYCLDGKMQETDICAENLEAELEYNS